jgi:flavin-dependent dehydrogenase
LHLNKEGFHFTVTRDYPVITMIMRDRFDEMLAGKAEKAGAQIIQGTKVTGLEFQQDNIQVYTSNETYQCEFLVAADGAFSKTIKMTGLKDTRKLVPALECEYPAELVTIEQLQTSPRFDMGFKPYAYGWCFPKQKYLSIGVVTLNPKKVNLNIAFRDYLQLLGLSYTENMKTIGHAIPIKPLQGGFFRHNVLFTGDAAGFPDPITMEGISHALLSGKLAARALTDSAFDPAKTGKLYNSLIKQHILKNNKTTRLLYYLFYYQHKLRKYAFKNHGQKLCEFKADIFCGERTYPGMTLGTLSKVLRMVAPVLHHETFR